MNEQENYNYESALDALLDYIQRLPKPTVKLLNFQRYQHMMEATAILQKLVAETIPEDCLKIEIEQEYNLGFISIELPELSVLHPMVFVQSIRKADNFEIYPLTNGNIRLDITFQRIFNGRCGNGNSYSDRRERGFS